MTLWLRCCLLLSAAWLSACAGTPVHNPDTAGSGSGSGVTVYGTADVGVGRSRR